MLADKKHFRTFLLLLYQRADKTVEDRVSLPPRPADSSDGGLRGGRVEDLLSAALAVDRHPVRNPRLHAVAELLHLGPKNVDHSLRGHFTAIHLRLLHLALVLLVPDHFAPGQQVDSDIHTAENHIDGTRNCWELEELRQPTRR